MNFLGRNITPVVLAAFLFLFSWGAVTMPIDEMGNMFNCPFLITSSSICTMTFSEHLSLWRSMFIAALDNDAGILAALGLIILAVSLALRYLEADQDEKLAAYKFYIHEHQESSAFNKLIELFSRGILNPKIYSLAAL